MTRPCREKGHETYLQDHPGNRNSLLFTAADHNTPLADLSVIPIGPSRNDMIKLCFFSCVNYTVHGSFGVSVIDVIGDSIVKEDCILGHDGNGFLETENVDGLDVLAVDCDGAVERVIEAVEEFKNS